MRMSISGSFWSANKNCTLLDFKGYWLSWSFHKVLQTVLGPGGGGGGGIRSEMQVFLKADNAALGKMSFHLCNWNLGLGCIAGGIRMSIYNSSLRIFILEYDLNAQTAILNISVGAEGP